VSTSATVVVPRKPRFRLGVLLLRMCCLKALPRRNFPRLVRLKRLAAPRWVLSFGIDPVSLGNERSFFVLPRLFDCRRRAWLRSAALRTPAQDGVRLVAFHPRHRLGDGHLRQFFHQPLQDAAPHLRASPLTASKK